MWRLVRGSVAPRTLMALVSGLMAVPSVARAHGPDPGPVEPATLITGWSFHAEVWLPIVAAWWLYRVAMRRVDAAHPGNPVPRYRWWSWQAGLGMLVLALASPIERYDTTLFSAHMVQHLLLTLVAPPLLLLGAPITLLLRAVAPVTRQRVVLPVLHSRVVALISNPFIAWALFAAVMWGSHFTPLFDAALEDPLVHLLEHGLFLGVGLLFWWPVVGADPGPRRLPHAARLGYLGLGMPLGSFLGLAIFSSSTVLYAHYATLERDWGPSALEDQALAGGIMWAGGDLAFLVGLVLAVWVWLRSEEAAGRRIDEQLDREARGATVAAEARAAAPVPPGSARTAAGADPEPT